METKKRDRASPKKNKAYDFNMDQAHTKLQPSINFKSKPKRTAKKQLTLSSMSSENDKKDIEKESIPPLPQLPTKCDNQDGVIVGDRNLSARELRKFNREKTNAVAAKLLSKKKVCHL